MADLQALATLEDYEARYGTVAESERTRLSARLADATALILSEMPGYEPGYDEVLDHNAQAVCCEMVHRAVTRPDGLDGVTQLQQTAGSLSASMSLSNPDGALYLSRSDRSRLGLDACVVCSARMSGGGQTWS